MHSHSLDSKTIAQIARLVQSQKLPDSYLLAVNDYLAPIADAVCDAVKKSGPTKLGIQGSQGSGKSTAAMFIAKLLEVEHGLSVAVCSIDDFYLTRQQRIALANDVHPLLATRGVPGTHDTQLISDVFTQFEQRQRFELPVFEKHHDDRAPEDKWVIHDGPVDVLIFEGWCVGLGPQSETQLLKSCNDLEELEDPKQIWRQYVNDKLSNEYHHLFDKLDLISILQAPSFDCVHQWRSLQEEKLAARILTKNDAQSKIFSSEQLIRFIAHFQRLTQHGLETMPSVANFILTLEANHAISKLTVQTTGAS